MMSTRRKNYTIGNIDSDDDLEEIKVDGNRKSVLSISTHSKTIQKSNLKNKKTQNVAMMTIKESNCIIDLDIGGTHQISVSRSLLCKIPCSKLKNTFEGEIQLPLTKQGRYFIESDGRIFSLMISYLQKDQKISNFSDEFTKGQFELELEYWQIDKNRQEQI